MKERPILFSASMVRALLDGSKTQTRRMMRFQPSDDTAVHVKHFHQTVIDRHGDEHPGSEVFGAWWNDGESGLRCPYGQPGDRLWVRETHAKIIGQSDSWIETDYRATYTHGDRLGDLIGEQKKWTSAIQMPRDASRLLLEVTNVRVERLQDISEADCIAEGMSPSRADDEDARHMYSPRWAYEMLWNQINGLNAWDANPWVWAVSFKRINATTKGKAS